MHLWTACIEQLYTAASVGETVAINELFGGVGIRRMRDEEELYCKLIKVCLGV